MKRARLPLVLLGVLLLGYLFALAPVPVRADGPCPGSGIPFPTNFPITSAGLLCDASGNLDVNVKIGGASGLAGSITAAGVNGTLAQAIQGITGGVPVPVSGTFSATTVFPYTYSAAQTATAASFLGVGGYDGTHFQPFSTNTSGQVITVFPSAQPVTISSSGTLPVNVQNASVAVTGTFYQATQPVSLASIPPVVFASPQPVTQSGTWSNTVSGTVTANAGTGFPGIGTAGSASSNVITVQGISGGTNLNVNCAAGCSGSSLTLPYSGTSNGQTATTASFLGAGGLYNSTPPTLTNTQFSPTQLDSSGNTKVNVAAGTVAATQSGTWNIGSITTLPGITGTVTANAGTGFPAITAAGTSATGSNLLTVQGSASGVAIPVSGSFYQTTQPVSGTVTANAGTGFPALTAAGTSATGSNLITVQGSSSGAAIPVSGTFWQSTQPVSGTVTANAGTGFPGLGTAGSANSNVITVQGISGGTNLNVNCASGCATLSLPYSGTSNGQTATSASFLGAGGLYNSSAPTLTNTQFSPFQLDASGNLDVNVKAGSGSTVFPYSGTSSGQTATSASFLGAAGIYNSTAPTLTNTQAAPIQLDASGNTKVNVAAGTVAATQSGTWNIGSITTLPSITGTVTANAGTGFPALTAAGTSATGSNLITVQGSSSGAAIPVSGTFWQTTQPVSGTVTANAGTGFPGLGTAGSANSNVITVQGISGGTNLNVNCASGCSGASLTLPYSGTSNGQTATSASFLGSGGLYNSTAPTLTNTQFAPTQLDSSGNTKVNVAAGTVAATQSGTWNIGSITTLPSITGTVTANAGTGFPALYSSGSAVSGSNVVTVQGASGGVAIPVSGTFYQSTQPVSGTVTANAGTGFPSTTTAGSSGTNLITVQGSASGVGIPVTGTFYQSTQPVSIASAPPGPPTTLVQVSLDTSSTTYSAGHCFGSPSSSGGAALVTLSNMFRSDDAGVLESISLSLKDVQTSTFKIYVFNASPGTSVCSDTGAASIASGDVGKLIGEYTLSANDSGLGTNTIYTLSGIGAAINSTSTSMYLYIINTSAVTTTVTSGDTITVGVLDD